MFAQRTIVSRSVAFVLAVISILRALPAAAGPGAVAVNLGIGVGRPGGIACVPATLAAAGAAVSSTQTDVGFDPTLFSVNGCTINPAIGNGSAAAKQVTAGPNGSGSERVTVAGSGANAIPDGLLYTCPIAIAPGSAPGMYGLTNAAAATNTAGTSFTSVSGASGEIRVTTCTGDCNGSGVVSIGEVLRCVGLFLGQPLCDVVTPILSCPVADGDLNGHVSIGEVQQCVNRFLQGCGLTACPYSFASDSLTLGAACFYTGPFNANASCPNLSASFLSDGTSVVVTFNTAPALSFAATMTSPTTASLSSYTLGTDPPQPIGGTMQLQQSGSLLSVTPQPALPFEIGSAGCTLDHYIGTFTQVVSSGG